MAASADIAQHGARAHLAHALKASGCGALRDGVYLLPNRPDCAQVLDGLADEVRHADGEATQLAFAARDAEQQRQFEALFDRFVRAAPRGRDCGDLGIRYVFAAFAAVALAGGLVTVLFAIKTKGRALEEVSHLRLHLGDGGDIEAAGGMEDDPPAAESNTPSISKSAPLS